MTQILLYTELTTLLLLILFSEIRYFKVPNKVTLPYILLGLVTNSFLFGFRGMLNSLGGIILPIIFAILIIIVLRDENAFAFGLAKFLAGIGSVMGLRFSLTVLDFSLVIGIAIFCVMELKYREESYHFRLDRLRRSPFSFLLYPQGQDLDESSIRFVFVILLATCLTLLVKMSFILGIVGLICLTISLVFIYRNFGYKSHKYQANDENTNMNPEDLKNALIKLEPYKRKGWKPVIEEVEGSNFASKFSGIPYLTPNEKWPKCPNCNKEMQLFLQLNLEETPKEFRDNIEMQQGVIQLFYCTSLDPMCECDCEAYEPFSKSVVARYIDEISDLENINIIKESKFFPVKTIVSWNEVEDYPSWEERSDLGIKLRDEEEDAVCNSETTLSGDKLGGWPYWVQGVEYPKCPICNKNMRLLFQIDSEDNLPYMFGDMGCGHITQCGDHKNVLAFSWACH